MNKFVSWFPYSAWEPTCPDAPHRRRRREASRAARSRGGLWKQVFSCIHRCFLVVGIAFLLQSAALAGVWVGDVEVAVQPTPSRDSISGGLHGTCHGYVELRVQLKNNSAEDRIVHLSYPPSRDGLREFGTVVSRTVHVAGKQAVSVSLYQPPQHVAKEALEVSVKGVKDAKIILVGSTYSFNHNYNETNRIAVLLGRGVPQEFRGGMRKESATAPVAGSMGTSSPSPEAERFAFLRSELPVSQWSHNWLGYSCFDAIVLSGKEAEQLPSQVRLAIRRWLECGGTLLVHSKSLPEEFSQGGRADGVGGYAVGLGRAAAGLADGETDWKTTYRKLIGSPIHIYLPVSVPDNRYDLLVAETTIPVRGLFVLVLLFGVCIGPANLWLLSKYKRRIWLWWNVPAISLLTCLTVFGYSLASEGWTGRGKTASLTLLDERCHRATTIGFLSFYCPLTPSSGPRFHTDTEVTLLDNEISPWRRYSSHGSDTMRFINWTNNQHLTSGWVTARVPAYFQIRKNEDRRERLTVEKNEDGTLKVVNALGADIRRLCLADSSGRIFEAHEIPAGAERTLKADEKKHAAKGADLVPGQIALGANWLQSFRNLTNNNNLSTVLSPGTYVAILDRSPFVESPLDGAETEDTAAIVYGISKGQQDGR